MINHIDPMLLDCVSNDNDPTPKQERIERLRRQIKETHNANAMCRIQWQIEALEQTVGL